MYVPSPHPRFPCRPCSPSIPHPPLTAAADMIHENSPVTNTFVSVPADMGHLNCAAFIAGIIAGALDSARFVRLPPHFDVCGDNVTHSLLCLSISAMMCRMQR